MPPLVRLLGDEEDKTRANAAAALGNLVRNSAALCGDLVRAGESISILVWAIRMTSCFVLLRGAGEVGGSGRRAASRGGGC